MSSTVSSTQVQTISKTMILTHKMEDRRLVRTSSLEKIRRFNSFICSQQYYILPALLAWLRSSQSVLQASTEKTIFIFRSLIFSHVLYRLYQVEYKSMLVNNLVLLQKQCLVHYGKITQPRNLLKIATYVTASVLVSELGLCFYLLWKSYVPSGLTFLIVCWFYIIYLNLKSVYYCPADKKNATKKRN